MNKVIVRGIVGVIMTAILLFGSIRGYLAGEYAYSIGVLGLSLGFLILNPDIKDMKELITRNKEEPK